MSSEHTPDLNRLSVLAAAILLAYALGRFADIPSRILEIQFLGLYVPLELNTHTVVAFLVAGLTASGADWLLRDHPELENKNPVEHWLLPALTAWVIGFPLFQLPLGLLWWAGFLLGAVLLILVLVAEYIVVDPGDIRQPAAAAGLIALSYVLYLILAVSMRYSGLRLVFIVPALTLASWLLSLRTLNLRLKGRWAFILAGLIALIGAQVTAALHYTPLAPVSFGLILLAIIYSLTSLIANLVESIPLRQAVLEPVVVLMLLLVTAMWLGG
ncbi:MAG: DUF5656 family protein [Anaerolineales bacterium]